MIVLAVVIVIATFLYLSLLALLRSVRERRKQERSGYKRLPRVGYQVIETLGVELKKTQGQGKLSQLSYDCLAEFREEQPFLFTLLLEILKEDLQGMTPAFMVYKLLKAQMEADLLDKSFNHKSSY